MSTKRFRGQNFRDNEKERLIKIIEQFAPIIENKKTDSQTNKIKSAAWDNVVQIYNSTSEIYRTKNQIKIFYDNYKTLSKKRQTDQIFSADAFTKEEELILKTIHNKYEGMYDNEDELWFVITKEFNTTQRLKRSDIYLRNVWKTQILHGTSAVDIEEVDLSNTAVGLAKKRKNSDAVEWLQPIEPPQNPYNSCATYFSDSCDDEKSTESTSFVEQPLEEMVTVKIESPSISQAIPPMTSPISENQVNYTSLRNIQTENNVYVPHLPSPSFESTMECNECKRKFYSRKEKLVDHYYKKKVELLELEARQKQAEHEERLKVLTLERKIREEELKHLLNTNALKRES